MKSYICWATFAGLLSLTNPTLATAASPVVSIVAPVSGEALANDAIVSVRVHGSGHPIVAIRSTEKNSVWWIQELAEQSGANEYLVSSRFGNDATPDGTRFQIIAMVSSDADSAAALAKGTSTKELPKAFPHSEMVEVLLDRAKSLSQEVDINAQLLTSIAPGQAKRMQPLSFRVDDADDPIPLLLIRAAERNGSWWVQDPLRRQEDGTLAAMARIGHDKTPAGSQFLLVLASPENTAAADKFLPGKSVKELSGLRQSQVFTLTTGSGDRQIAETK